MAAAPLIRVLVTDSRPLVLRGLRELIDARKPLMESVGQATSYGDTVELADRLRPEVVVFSFYRDPIDVLDAVKALVRCGAKVLLLKGAEEEAPVGKAIEAGAHGVVLAEDPVDSIVRAIIQVSHVATDPAKVWIGGLARLPARALAGREQHHAERARIARLTAREMQLIAAIVRNPSAKYIAIGSTLGISEHTVHNHLTNIYQKLELVNRIDLLVFAVKHQLGAAQDPTPSGWAGVD